MKKKLFLLVFMFTLLFPVFCNAQEITTTEGGVLDTQLTNQKPYYIKDYDVNLKLSEDHVLRVNEVIQLHFNKDDNCIIRYIPYKGIIERKDGTNSVFNLKMKEFDSNYSYEISISNNDYKVMVCTDEVYNEDKKLIMSYELVYDNSLNGEFNYNILDSRWNAEIQSFSYLVTYPKSFEADKLNMLYNGQDLRNYRVDNLKVSGELSELPAESEVIIRTTLDKDYFIKRNDYAHYNWIFVLVMVINVGVVYLIWRKNGKDFELVDTIELKKVDNYNSLELAYISTECRTVTDKMVFSLIIYLANAGYIKMERKFNSILLTKVKDYDGDNEIERVLMKRLFMNSNEFNYTDDNKVYRKISEKIRSLIDTRENRSAIMEKQPLFVKLLPFIFGVINILITTYLVLYGRSLFVILTTIILSVIGFGLLTYALTIEDDDVQTAVMWIAILLIFLSGFETTFDIVSSNISNLVYYFIGVLTFCMIMLLIYLMPKRSKEGNLKMSRAINFREFLRNPNDDLLGKLLKENKNYVYDIIAYAYAFSVEGEFLDTYNRLRGFINEPKWYKDTSN